MHPNSLLTFQKYCLGEFLVADAGQPNVSHRRGIFEPNDRVLELAPKGVPSAYVQALPSAIVSSIDLWVTDLRARRRGDKTIIQHDDYTLGCGPEEFDVVLAGNVLEHVWMPWRWIRELARVLRPGGRVILVSPVTWQVHQVRCFRGRRQDGWRVLPDGMRALFDEAGLETLVAALEQLDIGNEAAQRAQIIHGDPIDVIGIGRKP